MREPLQHALVVRRQRSLSSQSSCVIFRQLRALVRGHLQSNNLLQSVSHKLHRCIGARQSRHLNCATINNPFVKSSIISTVLYFDKDALFDVLKHGVCDARQRFDVASDVDGIIVLCVCRRRRRRRRRRLVGVDERHELQHGWRREIGAQCGVDACDRALDATQRRQLLRRLARSTQHAMQLAQQLHDVVAAARQRARLLQSCSSASSSGARRRRCAR